MSKTSNKHLSQLHRAQGNISKFPTNSSKVLFIYIIYSDTELQPTMSQSQK